MNNKYYIRITKPKHGWAYIYIQEDKKIIFTGSLSYIDNVLNIFLDTFITYLTTKTPVALEFDEEGTSFTIILMHDSIRIVSDRQVSKVDTFYMDPIQFITEICKELNKNLDEWIRFNYFDTNNEKQFTHDKNIALNKLNCIQQKLK